MEQLHKSLLENSKFQSLLSQIQQESSSYVDYKVSWALIFFCNAIWLNSNNPFQPLLQEEFHKTPIGRHIGIAKTLHKLQANFFWAQMRKDVKTYVAQMPHLLTNEALYSSSQFFFNPFLYLHPFGMIFL